MIGLLRCARVDKKWTVIWTPANNGRRYAPAVVFSERFERYTDNQSVKKEIDAATYVKI